jgi:hypothetical protein
LLSLWLLQNNAVSSFPKPEICFPDDLPSGKEEDYVHDLQIGLIYTTTTNGQGHGGVLGHLHLTRRGSSALSGPIDLTLGAPLPNGPIY